MQALALGALQPQSLSLMLTCALLWRSTLITLSASFLAAEDLGIVSSCLYLQAKHRCLSGYKCRWPVSIPMTETLAGCLRDNAHLVIF